MITTGTKKYIAGIVAVIAILLTSGWFSLFGINAGLGSDGAHEVLVRTLLIGVPVLASVILDVFPALVCRVIGYGGIAYWIAKLFLFDFAHPSPEMVSDLLESYAVGTGATVIAFIVFLFLWYLRRIGG